MPDDKPTPTGEQAGAAPNQQQPQEPPKDKTFTQDQINAAVSEEKKQWKAKLKDLEGKAAKWDELQEASKSEMEKLTGKVNALSGELTGAKLEAAKLRALAKAGADPEKLDALLKRVMGNTPEEIEADVKELQSLGLLQPKTPGGANGAGNPGLQKQQPPPNLDQQIAAAEKAGNWGLATKLKLDKQRTIFKV